MPNSSTVRKASILQVATIAALIGATLAAAFFTQANVNAEIHRQRVDAADRLALEINARIGKGLAAEEAVYALSNGLPDFSREQFIGLGRKLIRRFGFSYVGWAPAVDAHKRGAFERQHGLRIAGSRATADGILVPVLFSAQARSAQAAGIRPGLNLLSSPRIRPALVRSARTSRPISWGDVPVGGPTGVVLLQPMFTSDETGERIAGWVAAGIRADRLIGASLGRLPRGAAGVASDGVTIYGAPGAAAPEDFRTMSMGRSVWKLSVTGVGNRFSLLLPWLVLAVGLTLTTLVAFVLRQAARLDRARRTELASLEQAALVDSLTQLNNHRAFQEDLTRELERQKRSGAPFSLVILDLDGLKRVNDSLGHQAGDEMLKRLASGLTETMRGSDAAYRFGGDEFAVILAGNRAVGAFTFVQRLQAALAGEKAPGPVRVTAGIAEAVARTTKETLIRQADLALLEAKRSHRGALIYSPDLDVDVALADQAVEQHHRKTLASALARAVDAKDSYTRSHCETVSELCVTIAQGLGLEGERIRKMRLAGLLHDVGKIGITDAILQKPSRLTDEEFEVMKTHPTLGCDIVNAADMEEEARWILHHHERIDGRGYPDGLRGEEIPIESRIILVADASEAITSDRPYRKGQSEDVAFAELDRHAGTQFDPDCVAALKRALHGTGASAAVIALVSV